MMTVVATVAGWSTSASVSVRVRKVSVRGTARWCVTITGGRGVLLLSLQLSSTLSRTLARTLLLLLLLLLCLHRRGQISGGIVPLVGNHWGDRDSDRDRGVNRGVEVVRLLLDLLQRAVQLAVAGGERSLAAVALVRIVHARPR